MRDEPSTTVIVPVFRNADTLVELHSRLAVALDASGHTFELLFIDDASPDGALEVLRSLTRRDPRVGVIALSRNVGQHRAVLMGLLHAAGRTAVVMDGDLQDPPEEVPRLLAELGPGAAAVFAGRRGRYESRGRLLTSRLFKTLLHLVARVPRDAGMFVAMTREMIDRLVLMDDPKPFVVALLGATGLPLRSVPVARQARPRGSTAYTPAMRLTTGSRALCRSLERRFAPPLPARRLPEPVREILGAPFRGDREVPG